MTEQRNQLAALFAACWKDEALKARFMADPKAVLAEYGIDVPANIDVNVVENTDNTVHITLPAGPGSVGGLTDAELTRVAGGNSCYDNTINHCATDNPGKDCHSYVTKC